MENLDPSDIAGGIKLKQGWVSISFRAFVVIALTFTSGYVVLWADAHNDARYVKRDEYARDQAQHEEAHQTERTTDAALEQQKQANTDQRLAGMEKWLSEISGDVKQLLRENRGTNK